MTDKETCGTCRFWKSLHTYFGESGQCRYNPPVVLTINDTPTVFPITEKRSWCGKHRPEETG